MDDDLVLGGGLKDLQNLQFTHKSYSKQWSMVVIRDSSAANSDGAVADDGDDHFSVFPPSNHENLIPADFGPRLENLTPSPLSPMSPLSFPSSDSDPSPSPPPPAADVAQVSSWWDFAFRILKSKMVNLGNNGRAFWSFGNVALAMVVVVWWWSVRVRRRQRRRESIGQLLQVIRQKDEKIIQLLNQIAQMNELLLARHKVLA